jgi:Nucleotidyl transferase AbiEii toxin, Type IV TA system
MSDQQIEGSIFKFLSSVFKRHDIQAVLVGGYALIANKVQRMTFDIDFLISQEACNKIEADIINAGYSPLNRQDAFVQFKSEKIGLRDIDFLIGDEHTIDLLIDQGKRVFIAGEPFIVPSPEHLIAMKLHSIAGNKMRELKDFPDIVNLLAANSIDPLDEKIKSMFDKYALGDFYKRVITAMRTEHGK